MYKIIYSKPVSLWTLRDLIKEAMYISNNPDKAKRLFDSYKKRGGKYPSIAKICGES